MCVRQCLAQLRGLLLPGERRSARLQRQICDQGPRVKARVSSSQDEGIKTQRGGLQGTEGPASWRHKHIWALGVSPEEPPMSLP